MASAAAFGAADGHPSTLFSYAITQQDFDQKLNLRNCSCLVPRGQTVTVVVGSSDK